MHIESQRALYGRTANGKSGVVLHETGDSRLVVIDGAIFPRDRLQVGIEIESDVDIGVHTGKRKRFPGDEDDILHGGGRIEGSQRILKDTGRNLLNGHLLADGLAFGKGDRGVSGRRCGLVFGKGGARRFSGRGFGLAFRRRGRLDNRDEGGNKIGGELIGRHDEVPAPHRFQLHLTDGDRLGPSHPGRCRRCNR